MGRCACQKSWRWRSKIELIAAISSCACCAFAAAAKPRVEEPVEARRPPVDDPPLRLE